MNITPLEDALNRAPFVPFEIVMDNGRTYAVQHSDFLLFTQSRRSAVVTAGDHVHVLDLDHMSSIAFPEAKPTTQTGAQ